MQGTTAHDILICAPVAETPPENVAEGSVIHACGRCGKGCYVSRTGQAALSRDPSLAVCCMWCSLPLVAGARAIVPCPGSLEETFTHFSRRRITARA